MLTANVMEFPNSNKWNRELPRQMKTKEEIKDIERDMIKSYMKLLSNYNSNN